MEKEPLLPYSSSPSRSPPLLFPLPGRNEITLPLTPTPSELKDRVIFGPPSFSPQDHSPLLLDALNSSSSHNPFSRNDIDPESQSQIQQSFVINPDFKSNKSFHRCRTAPAIAVINEINDHNVGRAQFGKQSIVRQAFILLLMYLSLGVIIYCLNRDNFSVTETHPIVDALYFCIVTMCTIGYGDIIPNSNATKLFSIMFVLVGFGFVDILLSGMVSYVLDLQESYLLKNVKGKDHRSEKEREKKSYIFDVKKGRMRIRMKVGLALGVVVLCIGIGAGVMHFLESLEWLDAVYLSVMSVTTVGYGDQAFVSMSGRIFASVWLLVSTLAVARAFLYLAEARVHKRQREMAKWILGHDMTVSEFLAADVDNNGFVSKSEYVIYKLKEMGKISQKDVIEICNTFNRLDTGHCGKITLGDLMESHH